MGARASFKVQVFTMFVATTSGVQNLTLRAIYQLQGLKFFMFERKNTFQWDFFCVLNYARIYQLLNYA